MAPSTQENNGETSAAESLRARMGELRNVGATGVAPQHSLAEIVKQRKAAEAAAASQTAEAPTWGTPAESAPEAEAPAWGTAATSPLAEQDQAGNETWSATDEELNAAATEAWSSKSDTADTWASASTIPAATANPELDGVTSVASQMRAQEQEAPAEPVVADIRTAKPTIDLPETLLTEEDEDEGGIPWAMVAIGAAALIIAVLAWMFLGGSSSSENATGPATDEAASETDETPIADEAPVDTDEGSANADDDPIGEVVAPPVDEAPVDETPVDETPVDETPVDETPVDETPVDETPVDETPVDEAPAEDGGGFTMPEIILPADGETTEPAEPADETDLPVGPAGPATAASSQSYLDGDILVLEGAGSSQTDVDAFVAQLEAALGAGQVQSNLTVEEGATLPNLAAIRIEGSTANVAAFSDYLVNATAILSAFPESELSVVAQPAASGPGSNVVAETQRADAIVNFFENTGFSRDRLTATTLPASDDNRPDGGFTFLITNLATAA